MMWINYTFPYLQCHNGFCGKKSKIFPKVVDSGGCLYLQAICIIIQLKKHLSHFSFVLLHLNDSFSL